jgi:hypothetical protein
VADHEAVARGYLDAPGFFANPLVRQAYLGCQWSGPIMGQLNPLEEVGAAEKRVEMGVSTLEEETAELTGGDDWDLRRKLGLTVETTAQRIVTESIQESAAGAAGSGGQNGADVPEPVDTNNADAADARELDEQRANLAAIAGLTDSVRVLAERPLPAPVVNFRAGDVHVTSPARPGAKVITTPKGETYRVEEEVTVDAEVPAGASP